MNSTGHDQILIWGTGGHAKVVADIISQQSQFEIAGFLDDAFDSADTNQFLGHQVHGSREALPRLQDEGLRHIAIAIGNCEARSRILLDVQKQGWNLPVLIHPHTSIASDVTLGPGIVICAGAIIGPSTDIAAGCIINTAASVDHDCKIEHGVHICPGARLAGHISIGQESWIGIGSTIIEQTKIGQHVQLGAGSVVLNDLPSNCKAWGVPAKIQSK
ncbi:MAG: acetyltransferase [Planctomycetaceae bacterium]|nr:acetyltransferase [Planctomycetaceae bacterium]